MRARYFVKWRDNLSTPVVYINHAFSLVVHTTIRVNFRVYRRSREWMRQIP